jgi:hypothetical protein
MPLADSWPPADRWQFLQHPEEDFWILAEVANSLSWEGNQNLDDTNARAERLCQFMGEHASIAAGTMVRVETGLVLVSNRRKDFPASDDAAFLDVIGRGTLRSLCICPELVADGGQFYFGDRADIFLELQAYTKRTADASFMWCPSKYIQRLRFLGIRPEQLN